ncbi:ABC transporter permease [Lentibacter sp. XHP0401]|jgi:ABC-type polysaccharide/polyol phosphate export permease|uniref:ABC transporter permease n=1 Tax=Lentibacter sp. XHP0401 TaxID=2984334 RepID=UPI0021E89BAE|nr:ABC transporter permease [Lentibacter sp. XHP0401]MCV2892553.1 ABC transporter permease [Lentibacter sp. XHP0401]
MFRVNRRRSAITSALIIFELIYHSVVHSIRSAHGNAIMSLVTNLMQMAIMILAFYIMFSLLGLRGAALRGDFLIYIMSGIFLYMTHVKAVGSVSGSAGPSSPMMLHAPMNTIVSIASAALASLYLQFLSAFVILFCYYMAVTSFVIDKPMAVIAMLLLAWFTGCAVGMVLLAIKPWFPGFVAAFTLIYQRANMIASGKMFVANSMPSFMLAMFDWNPLFHIIDQSRGFAFINYNPRNSNWEYALIVGIVLIMIGLMGEFYTRRNASVSWNARR